MISRLSFNFIQDSTSRGFVAASSATGILAVCLYEIPPNHKRTQTLDDVDVFHTGAQLLVCSHDVT